MIRILAVVLLVWLLMLVPWAVTAQPQIGEDTAFKGNPPPARGQFSFIPQVGLSVPLGDFASTSIWNGSAGFARSGGLYGGAMEYAFTPHTAFGVSLFHNEITLSTPDSGAGFHPFRGKGNWKFLTFGAYLKYLFPSKTPVRGFLRGGLVTGAPKAEVLGSAVEKSTRFDLEVARSFGFDLAVGFQHFTTSASSVFLEFAYTILLTGTQEMTVTGGQDLTRKEAGFNAVWTAAKVGIAIFFGDPR